MFILPIFTTNRTEAETVWETHHSKNRHSLFSLLNNHLVDYPTPITITYTWGFGSIAGIFLSLQIITGLILAMHYAPNVAIAFDTLEHIMRDVNNGWLLRYLHANGASFFFVVVYLHIGRGLYYFSYIRNPFVWLTGMIIFALMMAIAFMGYVLPWGQMSFWGATVITNLFSAIPLVGQDIAFWLWGGFSVDNPTLNRFFALHFVLPFALLGLVGLHLIFLHRIGSSNPLAFFDQSCDKIPFFPYFYWKDLVGLFFFFLTYAYFTFFLPDTLGHPDNYIEGNSMVTPTHIVPEWYFLPFYAILRSIPDKLGGVILMAASILALFALAIWNPIINSHTEKAGTNFSFLTLRNNLLFHIAIWFFFFNVALLAWIGSQPVTPIIVLLGQINTLIYFIWLVYFPVFSLLDPKEAGYIVIALSIFKKLILLFLGIFYWSTFNQKFFNSFFSLPISVLIINTPTTANAIFFCLLTLVTLYFTTFHAPKQILKLYYLEIVMLSLFSVIPLYILVLCPINWIYFYLLFEISALSTTILIASRRYNPYSVSAGIMYYFISIIASLFLLVGIFFFYFEFGSFDLLVYKPTLTELTNVNLTNFKNISTLGTYGSVFILLSFSIKIGIAPFHAWTIGVNTGAPLHITAYLQTIYKALLITILITLLWKTKANTFFAFEKIDNLLGIGGLLTLFICSFGAIIQSGIKQFWAYLSTATVGFLFILLALSQYTLALMYMIIYFLTATTFFSILLTLTKKHHFIYLTDFKYTQKLNIFFVIVFIFLFLIFAGLPPTIGFYLKFISYFFILQQYGIITLLSVVIWHLITTFLYLKILKIMVFDKYATQTIIDNKKIFNGTIFDSFMIYLQVFLLIMISFKWNWIYELSTLLFTNALLPLY